MTKPFNNNFYGVDVVIENHTGSPLCYEINGIHSGMKGFMRLGTYEPLLDTLVDRIIEAADGKPIVLMRKPAAHIRYKTLKEKLEEKGEHIVHWASSIFESAKNVEDDTHGIIFGSGLDFPIYAHNPLKITNPVWLECFTAGKILQQVLLNGTCLAGNIPATAYVGNNIQKLDLFLAEMEEKGTSRFLYKPNMGAQGNGIEIIDRDKALDIRKKVSNSHGFAFLRGLYNFLFACHDPSIFGESSRKSVGLFQEFRESKPILSSETGKYHSACARVIHFNGVIDGYWRLSPTAVDDTSGSESDKHVVNLARNGLVERMSDDDKIILFPFVDELIQVYENQLRPFSFRHPAHFSHFKGKVYDALFRGEDVTDLTTHYNPAHKDFLDWLPLGPKGLIGTI